MPTACINQSNCQVHLKSERLEVFGQNPESKRDELLRQIPLRDLDRLIITESVEITSRALAAVLRNNIPISVFAWNGQYLGGFQPAINAHGLARLQQYQLSLNGQFILQMAGRIVAAKIYNQRRVLQRLMSSRVDKTVDAGLQETTGSTLKWMDSLIGLMNKSTTVEELRGYEGTTSARYFQTWGLYLPREFPFERRSTRPPLNPVNACISFGATLLYTEMAAFLHAHGLDAALGFLHATENGRWSLALDLMEPFRPVLVEALALDLFSHQILNKKHFEPQNGGIYLNEDGRKKFILQYERRMERQFMSESVEHRTTLRQQLENQAVMLKASFEDPTKFEPFLMN